ncbi:MAG: flagellar hook-length control protein FliK [Nitrosomonas sp. PRO4]|nr:flagellar hook-length control protein FliK [Nitrosomonas sp. PRO4]
MLNINITAAPQVNSSTDSPVMINNAASVDTHQPSSEEFAKVLEREVSGSTNKSEANATTAATAESSEKEALPNSDNPVVNVPADTSSMHTQANNLFINLTVAEQLPIHSSTIDPGTSIVAAITPAGLSTLPQNTFIPQDGKLVTNPVFLTNQVLQQKIAQTTALTSPLASNFTFSSDDFWQSLDMADSAAPGKSFPLPIEGSDAFHANTKETLFPVAPESIAPQSSSLTHSTSTSSLYTGPQSVQVDLPVDQPKWGSEFAQKIVWLTSQQHQVAEIRLNPAHLGPVEVMLTITQDQATAQFLSPHPAVREAIEQALPRLREMMAENGIQLGNVMVGADSFQQGGRQQQTYTSTNNMTKPATTQVEAMRSVDTTIVSTASHHGIVNTYA